jgi:phage terminase large subunit-like protein
VQDFGFEPAAHHLLLIEKLEEVISGQIDRLMVFMPPGSAKSTYVSELLPPFWFNKFPQSSVIGCSHTGELAERFGRKVRNKILQKSDVLGYSLDESNRAASRWETTTGGEYFAAGVGGAITGRRADLALIDDPVKSREEAESETVREKTYEWYKSDLVTRLKPKARIILIQTRWHIDDLGGKLIHEMEKGGDQWVIINLPAFAVPGDPLGRAVNEPLWPDWENKEALERKRTILGYRDFESLYQQNPQPPGGYFFLESDLLVDGKPVDYPAWSDCVFATIDTAIKTNSKHDATAVIYWSLNQYFDNQPLTILDYELVQVEADLLIEWIPNIYRRLEEFAKQCKARRGSIGTVIEDKGSGTVLLQQCNRKGLIATAIDAKLVQLGKDARCLNVSGYVNSGKVKYSEYAYRKTIDHKQRHANHLVKQVHQFNMGVKDQDDDLVDCFTYGIASALGDPDLW